MSSLGAPQTETRAKYGVAGANPPPEQPTNYVDTACVTCNNPGLGAGLQYMLILLVEDHLVQRYGLRL